MHVDARLLLACHNNVKRNGYHAADNAGYYSTPAVGDRQTDTPNWIRIMAAKACECH